MRTMNDFTILPDTIPLSELRRVLVIKLRHHGDVLLSSPVFSVLKNRASHLEIDALVYADTAAMLTLHPAISQVHTIGRQWKREGKWQQIQKEWQLLQALRGRHYDLVIHLTEHWRGAWLARLTGARWAVGPVRKERGKRWKKRFTHLYPHPSNALRHTTEYNLDALRRIGIQPSPAERRLCLVAGTEAEQVVAAKLQQLNLVYNSFIHIHPASRWFFKCWSIDNMAALIQQLVAAGQHVLLTAAPDPSELAMLEAIQSRLPARVPSLAGELNLKELTAVTAAACLFIGVDSAPMHIAAAVGTPVVALFGPSGDKQWGPWGVPQRILTSQQHPCRPCGLDGCGGGKVSDCLQVITPEDVLAAVNSLLEETTGVTPLTASSEGTRS